MTDAFGWRKKFAVLVPSTNTAVQPEFDEMRPHVFQSPSAGSAFPTYRSKQRRLQALIE